MKTEGEAVPNHRKLLTIDAFKRAFEIAKEFGIAVKIEPCTTPVPKEPYSICMKLLCFENQGDADLRAIDKREQVTRETGL